MFQLLRRWSQNNLSSWEETKAEKSTQDAKWISFSYENDGKEFPDAVELEARATVKFDAHTFFKEMIYHIFFPFSVPLMMWLDGGWYALVNRGFCSTSRPRLAISQAALAGAFYTFNGVSLFFMGREHHGVDFLYDVALVDILWVIRNAVVATKYAFASKVFMKEMRMASVDPSLQFYQTLLGGWSDPIPRTVLKEELLLAPIRCRKILPQYSFQLDTSIDSLEALRDMISDLQLDKDDPKKHVPLNFIQANRWLEAGREDFLDPMAWTIGGALIRPGSLPVRLYVAHVIHQSSSLSRLRRVGHTLLSQHLKKAAFFVSLGITVLPFVLRTLLGGHPIPGPHWTSWAIGVSSFLLLYFSLYSNVAFMMVGILDFRRRHYVASKLDELLRTGTYTGSQHIRTPGTSESLKSRSLSWLMSMGTKSSSSRGGMSSSQGGSSRGSSSLTGQGIVVDFHDPMSLQAWWICRVLAHDFGQGFHKRIKYYTTYFACYCGVLIVLMAMRLITGIKKADIYILITVIVCLDVFLTLLALMVWPGGDINRVRQIQGATLTYRKLRLQMKLDRKQEKLSCEELKKVTAFKTMSSIAEAVNWDNRKNQVSVCGFQAGEQLLSVIVAIVTGSISIGVGQIVTNVVSCFQYVCCGVSMVIKPLTALGVSMLAIQGLSQSDLGEKLSSSLKSQY